MKWWGQCHDLSFLDVEFQTSFFTLFFHRHQEAVLSFKPAFSLSSFTLNKKLFSSSSLSVIRVLLFAYLRLLIRLQAILIPACNSSNLAFLMMYSAYKLNKQGNNIQCLNSFPNSEPVTCSVSGSNCCFLSYIQVSQEAGKVVWYSYL